MAKRAVCYLRVSTRGQEDNFSLAQQEDMTRARCTEKGYQIIAVLREVHTGAELDERPEMSKIREMIRRREIDVMVLISIDRLARNQNHQAVISYEADKYNVEIELTTEEYADTLIGRQIRSLKTMFAEMEREMTRERTLRGVQQRVKQGKMMPGNHPLYGYDWADDRKTRYLINLETAKIVRRIYDEAASGRTFRQIAADLSCDGIMTPTDYWASKQGKPAQGARWNSVSIHHILSNPAYYGAHSALRWKQTKRKAFTPWGEPKSVWVTTERTLDDSYRVALPDAAPAIVSEDTFHAVQKRLEFNRQIASRNNHHAHTLLLRGFVRCGLCGRNMVTSTRVWHQPRNAPKSQQRVVVTVVYRCRERGECPGTAIAAHMLDREIWRGIQHLLSNPQVLEEAIAKSHKDTKSGDVLEGYQRLVKSLETQQASVRRAISLLGEEEVEGFLADYREVTRRLQDARRDLQKAQNSHADYVSRVKRLEDMRVWCAFMSQRQFTHEEQIDLLYGLGLSVEVWRLDQPDRWTASLEYIGHAFNQRDCVSLPSTNETQSRTVILPLFRLEWSSGKPLLS